MKANLLSSRNIHAADVLKFVLEFVFGWSEVDCGNRNPYIQYLNTRYSSIKHKDRATALGFVTQWLGKAPDGQASSLPSLTTLCAQKIAMEVFWLFTTNIDFNFSRSNIEFFTDTLKSEMESSLNNKGVPESHHTLIIEELFIFTTIYILYVDLKRLSKASDIFLPVQRSDCRDDDWWEDFGISAVIDAVPDHGLGSLAKVALLPFIVYTNFTTIRGRDRYERGNFHLDAVFKMFKADFIHGYVNPRLHCRHPFACSVALTPLASLVREIVIVYDFDGGKEFRAMITEDILLPWIKQYTRIAQRDISSFSVMYAATMQSVNPPAPARLRPFQYSQRQAAGQDCVDAVENKELIKSLTLELTCRPSREERHVKRLRLNGNYSKGEILRAVIICRSAEVVDLEYCSNLDEECFDAIMHLLLRVRVVLLKGTALNENSAVVKRYRNSAASFVFSTACKCCGSEKGIKELRESNNS
mmetsp:Transcript_36091/g.73579  ORF Transcript_36091/g.73579 Transcript_36091/m.73579 type:complete len:472 (-) Transcript_36091:126-1541(-)